MDRCLPAVYRPHRPRDSPLYKLVEDQFETLLHFHEEHFQPRYGRLRTAARRAVEKFLECGILEQGFARVRCDRCKAEFLVAFSCKARILCPSCHAKKLEIWADWLEHELLYAVPHRQYVFTVPKRLRPFFLHDRKLLGVLARLAYRTLRDFMRATFREPDVVPGVLASIQTFGTLVKWHPHLHFLVTDGAFRPDGTFLHLGFHQIEVLTEAFRRAVFREFVRRELLDPDVAQSMLAWEHSGYHVHHGVRLEADDALGMLQLARYAARAPIALDRIQYDVGKKRVRLVSDKREGPTVGTHDFEPLEFLALLLAHVPDRHEILVRYSGAYSVRRRARWRLLGILAESRPDASARPGRPPLLARAPGAPKPLGRAPATHLRGRSPTVPPLRRRNAHPRLHPRSPGHSHHPPAPPAPRPRSLRHARRPARRAGKTAALTENDKRAAHSLHLPSRARGRLSRGYAQRSDFLSLPIHVDRSSHVSGSSTRRVG